MRAFRAANPGAETERYRSDPAFRKRVQATKRVAMQRKRGRITAQPCEVCGEQKVQAHYEDYEKPNEVRWLCLSCHGREHYPSASERELADQKLENIIAKHLARSS